MKQDANWVTKSEFFRMVEEAITPMTWVERQAWLMRWAITEFNRHKPSWQRHLWN